MAQSLLIGLGGTGSRVVNNVAKELRRNKKTINNGQMCCAVLDTNVNDNEYIINSMTNVPVIATSKAMKIRDYMEIYSYKHMDEWCPQSPSFLTETMVDGASECRMKSRIAFEDCVESGAFRELETLINDVLSNGEGSKIRIMIVSSLSGGTGSGMFIQTALWLRKILSQSDITIRGIFLLPDVFISTIDDIKNNKTTSTRHYCNAYAAIRELNTISKIRKSGDVSISEKLQIADLFDSDTDGEIGKPVFDYAFFIDDKDENGVKLGSISEYEKMVAQLVYMQLYAPMRDDMYSEEDNAFFAFTQNEEPLYGSCGTAKLEYPIENVKKYCALRATQDALTTGWKKIDSEIEALQEEIEQNEKDGIFSSKHINEKNMFIKLFEEKIAVKEGETGRDRFFISIAKDIYNEVISKSSGESTKKYTDKVSDFIKLVNDKKINYEVLRSGGTDEFAINVDEFVKADHTKEELLDIIKEDEVGFANVIEDFESKTEEYATAIVNSVFPYSMGDVRADNACSIYGLLTKKNQKGEIKFIHPVAARYILYKLAKSLDEAVNNIALNDSKAEALSGGEIGTLFDNPLTPEPETTPEAYLESKRKWKQRSVAFFDHFERNYAQFINTKAHLCEKYEKECLQVKVYSKLLERINALIEQVEAFFKHLEEVDKKLNSELVKNIGETAKNEGKVIFVLGDVRYKESLYKTLEFGDDKTDSEINRGVINAIYGRLCAEKRPSNPENKQYKDIGVITAFKEAVVNGFSKKIDNNAENSSIINMDVYSAICKETDLNFEKNNKEKIKEAIDFDNYDMDSDTVDVDMSEELRHRAAFNSYKNKVFRLAAPFLIHDREISNNELGTRTTREKTFWGFHPAIANSCDFLGNILGINADLQADDAYNKGELYCYRAVYGMEARYVPKFNEIKGGDYYKCYNAIVSEMVQEEDGHKGEKALVVTPHLDKRWHKILPYVTSEKQNQAKLEFYYGFWLAIAYGLIRADKDGNLCLNRKIDGGYGNYTETFVPIKYNNKFISKTDVGKLIESLKNDKVFTSYIILELEKRFAEEIEEMVTYVGTDVLKGLMPKKDDLNPIDVITRYNESRKHDSSISAYLIGSLEKIAHELASSYNAERSDEQINEAKYKICRMIYDSSERVKGRSDIFARWEHAFKEYKIEKAVKKAKNKNS